MLLDLKPSGIILTLAAIFSPVAYAGEGNGMLLIGSAVNNFSSGVLNFSNPAPRPSYQSLPQQGYKTPPLRYQGINASYLQKNSWYSQQNVALFRAASEKYNIPFKYLISISINESGKYFFPWPWTLNVSGVGYYYANREQEYQAAKYFILHHYSFVDIGPMQVDWQYHHKYFLSLWDATNPATNISAACYLLYTLHQKLGSWKETIEYYHSAIPAYGYPYLLNVLNISKTIKNNKLL